MKKFYSLSRAILCCFLALILFGGVCGAIIAYAPNESEAFPLWACILFCVVLSTFSLALIFGCFFYLQKITVTKNSIKVSLFKHFFIREFPLDSIVDTLAIYPEGKGAVSVIFSKIPLPDSYFRFASSKDERKRYLKARIMFNLSKIDIPKLNELLGKPIREIKFDGQ